MKIFITGAPGWLGTRCVELIVQKELPCQKKEYSLKCFALNGSDVSDLQEVGAEIVYGDIRDQKSLEGTMKDCDYVVHIAGIIHPKRIRELYEVNTTGTKNTLREALASGIQKFIYISSNSPAGFSKRGQLFSENDPPHPYMHYGKSKYLAELAVKETAGEGKMETVILRPCWFYGPRQPDRQTTFFQMIRKGNPVLFGDGSNLRSVSYVDTIVQGIVLSLEKEGINGETYWIADDQPYSTLQIYKTIADLLTVKELKPKKIPAWSSYLFEKVDWILQSVGFYNKEIHVAGEMSRNIACSVEKAKKELDYKPEISLREGMQRSIEWCRSQGLDI